MISDPLVVLDNMQSIVEREMIAHGVYLTDVVVNQELAEQGAICGGHKACAIGALYLAAGVPMTPYYDGKPEEGFYLVGVSPLRRQAFMADKPGLRLAYDALNAAALEYARANDIRIDWHVDAYGGLEALFESGSHRPYSSLSDTLSADVDKKCLLPVIEMAREALTVNA